MKLEDHVTNQEKKEQIYNVLMNKDFSKCKTDKAINNIGILIDISNDLFRTEGLKHAIKQSSHLLESELSREQKSLMHYFIGNAWSTLRVIKHQDTKTVWDWQQKEIEQEIYNLRLAIHFSNNKNIPELHLCQINTNLGNVLSHVGRFVYAIHYWNVALYNDQKFSMALANKGYGLIKYAQALYDNGHRGVFLRFAYRFLKDALKSEDIHYQARLFFENQVRDLESRIDKSFLEKEFVYDDFSLGRSKREKDYRRWCLDNGLFLNPLNDLGNYNIAAQDILTCPSLITSINESSHMPPSFYSYYNQLKQEFVSGRFLLFEGLGENKPHFSDKKVLLYNPLNYPCYGISVEKLKIAFRIVYSLFDKIAYFLNDYFGFKIPEYLISFRRIWYIKDKKSGGLRIRKEFENLDNWPLRGMFWLAKDLSEDRPEFRESMEPEAKDLVKIRNFLEHKYLTVTESKPSEVDEENTKTIAIWKEDFIQKVLRLFKLARAALIYLSLGIHIEECKKVSAFGENNIIAPMFLDTWEDEWKL